MRSSSLIALGAALVVCGCHQAAVREVRHAQEIVQLAENDRAMAFELLKPEEKLSSWERQVILAFQVKRLAGPGWRDARRTLVAMGKDSIPILIEALDRKDPVHHELKPRSGAEVRDYRPVFNLGEMAYDVLCDIVMHYSTYKGQLPPHSRGHWERWWGSNRSRLVVLGRGKRTLTKR